MWKTVFKRGIALTGIVMVVFLILKERCYAQQTDTTQIGRESPDSAQTDTVGQEHSPGKAALLSAALPGLGQIYNNKIWKVPIIYAGAGVIYYAYDFNATHYNEYKTAFTRFVNGKIQEYNGITNREVLKRAKDYYRRYRDMNLLIMTGLYLVQIIDATVDAYMFNFDVSEDIAFRLRSVPLRMKNYRVVPGIKCSIDF